MLTIICMLLVFSVFGALMKLSLKAVWGITKIIFSLAFLPVLALILIFSGMFLLAIPLLVISGIAALCKCIS